MEKNISKAQVTVGLIIIIIVLVSAFFYYYGPEIFGQKENSGEQRAVLVEQVSADVPSECLPVKEFLQEYEESLLRAEKFFKSYDEDLQWWNNEMAKIEDNKEMLIRVGIYDVKRQEAREKIETAVWGCNEYLGEKRKCEEAIVGLQAELERCKEGYRLDKTEENN